MSEERVVISAKISKEAAEGWRNFCDVNGISLTAMLEVAGLALSTETAPPHVKERQNMVNDAREVDRQRRVRQRS